jgi:hypothetical protein
MDVLRAHELKETGTTVRASQAALLCAPPGSLRNRVRVENFINHYGAGVDLSRQLLSARDVERKASSKQGTPTLFKMLFIIFATYFL